MLRRPLKALTCLDGLAFDDCVHAKPERCVLIWLGSLWMAGNEVLMQAWRSHEQIQRLMKRDGCTRELAEAKIASQMPQESKRRRSQYVVDNSGRHTDTASQACYKSALYI